METVQSRACELIKEYCAIYDDLRNHSSGELRGKARGAALYDLHWNAWVYERAVQGVTEHIDKAEGK